jgi:hypothetical protein
MHLAFIYTCLPILMSVKILTSHLNIHSLNELAFGNFLTIHELNIELLVYIYKNLGFIVIIVI